MGVFIQFNGNLKISDFAFGFACIVIFGNIFSIILFKVRATLNNVYFTSNASLLSHRPPASPRIAAQPTESAPTASSRRGSKRCRCTMCMLTGSHRAVRAYVCVCERRAATPLLSRSHERPRTGQRRAALEEVGDPIETLPQRALPRLPYAIQI
jgi:hypothetical protein